MHRAVEDWLPPRGNRLRAQVAEIVTAAHSAARQKKAAPSAARWQVGIKWRIDRLGAGFSSRRMPSRQKTSDAN